MKIKCLLKIEGIFNKRGLFNEKGERQMEKGRDSSEMRETFL